MLLGTDHETRKQRALQTIIQEHRSLCRCPSLQSQGLEGRVVEKCDSAATL